ncbi:hypothetical protein SAMN04488030_1699 [Aliiroseovarius halocynthiae]|uniref:Uncharacterized protein n=1 Tax=Aliiroseovarius halocynthiae TaxID=985055 RepID=A0A545SSB0_9RHOB|nr:hypothetical protein [Aliiroseovarius halocynthiae]TQV67858.1 hypothetical protein FIL88_08405 [Aliiroseovarius halocynthiae]SMR72950.1 hypothetical protein SAMN04488030_1699 [Aliiroseovarius halocynthiae]
MNTAATHSTTVPLRDPAQVMRLARLGSLHQSRLSFMRILTRRIAREGWTFDRPVFDIDAKGVGHAVLSTHTPDRTYSLVAFAHDLPADMRSDRVIAEAWDCTFTLFDGVPTPDDIARLSKNIPLQEAGRVTGSELSVSRANRSVRLWEHVVSSLAKGQQPDPEKIDAVGYLMRTTAVYGSGKLGAADREMIADRAEFATPFQVEMLSVFLTRAFVRDLVQHMANQRAAGDGKTAAKLDPEIARSMGIGNSTGLGMAPFLLNHPVLFNNWVAARETAIARVRSVETASADEVAVFRDVFDRSLHSVGHWHSEHPIQVKKLAALKADLDALENHITTADLSADYPWNRLYTWAETHLGVDAQECLASLILEPYGALVDDLADHMAADNTPTFRIAGAMTLGKLSEILQDAYGWAVTTDWKQPDNKARAWYVSEEKLEPRLGERFEEPIEDYEQPLAPGLDAATLNQALAHWPKETSVAEFLLRHPEYRHIVRRAQIVGRAPYAEIRDNTISKDVLPIDMLRCKLAFFGAVHFDPRSDRWVRICMYGNAPFPEEIQSRDADLWVYPDGKEV